MEPLPSRSSQAMSSKPKEGQDNYTALRRSRYVHDQRPKPIGATATAPRHSKERSPRVIAAGVSKSYSHRPAESTARAALRHGTRLSSTFSSSTTRFMDIHVNYTISEDASKDQPAKQWIAILEREESPKSEKKVVQKHGRKGDQGTLPINDSGNPIFGDLGNDSKGGFNLDFGSTDSGDVLETFDFDKFLHTNNDGSDPFSPPQPEPVSVPPDRHSGYSKQRYRHP